MPTTEVKQLLAAGVPVAGVGGEVRLRFSMRAIAKGEDRYGSMQGLLDELRWLNEQMLNGWPEPAAQRLIALAEVAAVDEFDDLLANPAELVHAINDAWIEAFPLPDEGKAQGAEKPPSPGGSGGASPSSTAP